MLTFRAGVAVCLTLVALVGCGSSGNNMSPELQQRLDALSSLQDMYWGVMIDEEAVDAIVQNSSQLAETETDHTQLASLAKNLRKMKPGSSSFTATLREIAELIPVPDKYAERKVFAE